MSYRFILIFIKEFFKRFKGLIFLGVFSGIVFFFLFRLVIPKIMTNFERIGVTGKYTPAELPNDILGLISDGLTKIDESGNVSPLLADSWETTDGGKTWRFNLRKDRVWHDGKPVNAHSINYEFSDATVEKIDDYTLIFKLNTPFSAFPSIVSKPVFKKGLLGTGEWKVKKVSLVGGYVNKLTLQDKKGNKKMFVFYPSEERMKLGYKLGEVDILKEVTDSKPFDVWKTAKIAKIQANKYLVAVFFNTEFQNLSEKTYRQALAYGIDKENFEGERAISPISPNSWAYNSQVKQYTQDSDRAKELLKDSKDNHITLSTASNLLPIAESIKSNWEAIGVQTDVQVVTGIPEEYEALLATVDIPLDPDQYVLWHSTQTETNISRFKNARVDKLLEDGRTQLNLEERKKIYLDFQRFLVEDVPAVFLYHPIVYTVTRK